MRLSFLRLCSVVLFVLPFAVCSSGEGPAGPDPNPDPTPTPTPPASTLVIKHVAPESGSTVCTGHGVVPLIALVHYSIAKSYSPTSVTVGVGLSDDGINPIPFAMVLRMSSNKPAGSEYFHLTPGYQNIISSQWLLATMEYHPNGIYSDVDVVVLARDRMQWALKFDWGC